MNAVTRHIPSFWTGRAGQSARPMLILVVVALITACGSSKKSPPAALERNPLLDSADQVMFGVRFMITDAGVSKAYVTADTSIFLNSNTRVEMLNVHITFLNNVGAKEAVLTSRAGTYRTHNGQMSAREDVRIVTEDGKTMDTDHVAYDQYRNEIYSDSAFVVTEPGRRLEGIGFRSDPNLQNVRILQAKAGSSGTITIPD